MFKQPFSFEGRIRRTEFGLSLIILTIYSLIAQFIAGAMLLNSRSSYDDSASGGIMLVYLIIMIPGFWFGWAQGAKRCHDLGNSGWFQLIPFYSLWMLFADGQTYPNEYGDNPKGLNTQFNLSSPPVVQPGTGYQGGYSGGHNNPGQPNYPNYPNNQQGGSYNSGSGEYKGGDLYR